jgi:hypothetical protein
MWLSWQVYVCSSADTHYLSLHLQAVQHYAGHYSGLKCCICYCQDCSPSQPSPVCLQDLAWPGWCSKVRSMWLKLLHATLFLF